MKQVKIFTGVVHEYEITQRGSRKSVPMVLDEDINEFIADHDVKIVDIKFSTVLADNNIVGTALLIYEEPDDEEAE